LWLVADAVAAERLVAEGIPRGRCWTVEELLGLLNLPDCHERRRHALARLEGDGIIAGVIPTIKDPIIERDDRDVCAPFDGVGDLVADGGHEDQHHQPEVVSDIDTLYENPLGIGDENPIVPTIISSTVVNTMRADPVPVEPVPWLPGLEPEPQCGAADG
jgi:hypothetical protein